MDNARNVKIERKFNYLPNIIFPPSNAKGQVTNLVQAENKMKLREKIYIETEKLQFSKLWCNCSWALSIGLGWWTSEKFFEFFQLTSFSFDKLKWLFFLLLNRHLNQHKKKVDKSFFREILWKSDLKAFFVKFDQKFIVDLKAFFVKFDEKLSNKALFVKFI